LRLFLILDEQSQSNLSKQEIAARVQEQLNTEYSERAFQTIETSAELDQISSGLGRLLVAQARSILIMQSVVKKLTDNLDKHLTSVSRSVLFA
jgi:hypothetical protein